MRSSKYFLGKTFAQGTLSRSQWLFPALLVVVILATPAAQSQSFTVLHNFTNMNDGGSPAAGLTIDAAGANLYGTTFGGGAGFGTAFRVKKSGTNFMFTSIYTFRGEPDGAAPYARIRFGSDGSLYGTTAFGGQGSCSNFGIGGCGTVFNLHPPLTICRSTFCPWIERVLYRFTGGIDGSLSYGEVTFDVQGHIFGTTFEGGAFGAGTAYELVSSQGSWTESVIQNFSGVPNAGDPYAGLIFDSSGNLYGTTPYAGPAGFGSVYELTSSGQGWTQQEIYGFQNGNDGGYAWGGLISDSTGNLYGTTNNAGIGGGGTVFKLTHSGGVWTYTVLYSFTASPFTGPVSSLATDRAGNLYGTTEGQPGTGDFGTVFELTQSNGGWMESTLHQFTGGTDGAYPMGTLALDASGNIYGTADTGGTSGYGVVFEITPQP
jgi:hypothetical protein